MCLAPHPHSWLIPSRSLQPWLCRCSLRVPALLVGFAARTKKGRGTVRWREGMNSHSSYWGILVVLHFNLLTLHVQPWRQCRVCSGQQWWDGGILGVPGVGALLADPLLLCPRAPGGPFRVVLLCRWDVQIPEQRASHWGCSGSELGGDPCSQWSSCDHLWDGLCSVLVVPLHQRHPIRCHPLSATQPVPPQ